MKTWVECPELKMDPIDLGAPYIQSVLHIPFTGCGLNMVEILNPIFIKKVKIYMK
jgi:hypothetical protein